MQASQKTVGFVGCPPALWFRKFRAASFVDLDNDLGPLRPVHREILPSNTCSIIKRIADNALGLKLDAIIFDEGYGKCDNGRSLAAVLARRLRIPVIRTRNTNRRGAGTPICDSALPARRKMDLILDHIPLPPEPIDLPPLARPPAAIWGVPASDFAVYDLLPDGTRILGWTRCLENKTPADEDLELLVEPGVPTIFLAQTFCHKNILARELATRYGGIYVDIDGQLDRATRSKIEAFLHFHLRSKG